jgi:hypothetical protein
MATNRSDWLTVKHIDRSVVKFPILSNLPVSRIPNKISHLRSDTPVLEVFQPELGTMIA